MNSRMLVAALAVTALVAPSAMAAVRPTVAHNLSVAPVAAGARIGASTKARKSTLAGTPLILALAGVGAAGIGIAAGAGAFDSNHHDTVSP